MLTSLSAVWITAGAKKISNQIDQLNDDKKRWRRAGELAGSAQNGEMTREWNAKSLDFGSMMSGRSGIKFGSRWADALT
jgi:hypothetical protein